MTISGLSSVGRSVIDLTSVPGTLSVAAPAAAVYLTDACVTSVSFGVVSSTAQGHKKDSHRKMNFSLKLDKFSGRSNGDANFWQLTNKLFVRTYKKTRLSTDP